ncbi:MAG TPA: hypothetical protein VFS40_04205 [Gemmatimonadales bacterium]|nr:hypothetical protein [Gemmatimonadales bacterium]
MNRIWLFLHLLGFVLWLGGALAAMVMGVAAKHEDRDGLAATVRAQAAVHRAAILPGALLTVLSGLVLTFRVMGDVYAGNNGWLILMQAAGIVAALVTLFISVPTAARLARLDPTGQTAAYFDELRARQRLVASVAGTLGLVALFAGAALRY